MAASGTNAFPYVDNLRVGTAILSPAPVPAAIGCAVAVWRRRKGEGAEVETEA